MDESTEAITLSSDVKILSFARLPRKRCCRFHCAEFLFSVLYFLLIKNADQGSNEITIKNFCDETGERSTLPPISVLM